MLSRLVPGSHVVKGFNTLSAWILQNGPSDANRQVLVLLLFCFQTMPLCLNIHYHHWDWNIERLIIRFVRILSFHWQSVLATGWNLKETKLGFLLLAFRNKSFFLNGDKTHFRIKLLSNACQILPPLQSYKHWQLSHVLTQWGADQQVKIIVSCKLERISVQIIFLTCFEVLIKLSHSKSSQIWRVSLMSLLWVPSLSSNQLTPQLLLDLSFPCFAFSLCTAELWHMWVFPVSFWSVCAIPENSKNTQECMCLWCGCMGILVCVYVCVMEWDVCLCIGVSTYISAYSEHSPSKSEAERAHFLCFPTASQLSSDFQAFL